VATTAEHLSAAYSALAVKLAEAAANPMVSYSVDGVSLDWGAYYRMLTDQMKAIREAMVVEQGPFEINTVAR
jgi:hypothetical protein